MGKKKSHINVKIGLQAVKYLFVVFVLFGFLFGPYQALAIHDISRQTNTNYETNFDIRKVSTTSHQAVYTGNNEKYSHTELTQATEEAMLVDFAEDTGYVHPLIAGFYRSNLTMLNANYSGNEKKESVYTENSTSLSVEEENKYLEYFDLKEKIPKCEGKTYDFDLNNTYIELNEKSWNNNTTLVTNFTEQIYGTYYMSDTYLTSVSIQEYTTSESTSSWEPDTRDIPAPIPIAKETHWFPKESHARLMYNILVHGAGCEGLVYVTIHIIIEADQDTYSRYFRVYMDSGKIYERIVVPSYGEYELTISTTVYNYDSYTPHLLTFEIYWGGQSEQGWRLKNLWIENSPANPPEAISTFTGEYFPRLSYSKLSWKVKCGALTEIDVALRRVNDPFSRWFKIFIDGQSIFSDILSRGQNSFEYHIPAGDFSDNSIHTVTLQINWGAYEDHGWCLEMFRVHHEGLYYEIDYMEGFAPRSDALLYIEEYYKNHGYHRVEFFVDETVSYDNKLTEDEYFSRYVNSSVRLGDFKHDSTFDHRFDKKWNYCIYGDHSGDDSPNALGWATWGYLGQDPGEKWVLRYIFIAQGKCNEEGLFIYGLQVERCVLMHEVGHTVNIIDRDSQHNEIYCSNPYCVMAMGSLLNELLTEPFYCSHHWRERDLLLRGWYA